MAGMSVEKFAENVIALCSQSFAVVSATILRLSLTWFRLRAYLKNESFVDVSYNEETGKITFAQIRNEQRVFGADNKQGWHWHPYEDPERHDFVEGEITFEEFLKQVEENLSK